MLYIFNPLAYLYSVSLLIEPLYLFLLFLTFNFALSSNDKNKYILVGLFSGLCFVARLNGLFVIISLLIYYSYFQKNIRRLSLYSLSVATVLISYFTFNYITTGLIFPYASQYSEVYPILWSGEHHLRTLTPLSTLVRIKSFGYDFTSLKLLSLLAPFVLLGVIKSIRKSENRLILTYVFISLVYHVGHHYTTRYMLPLMILTLPIGIKEAYLLLNKYDAPDSGKIKSGISSTLSIIIGLMMVLSTAYMPLLLTEHFISPYYDNSDEKYIWFNTNAPQDAVICSSNHMSTSYFTDAITIKLDYTHNNESLSALFSEYNVSYLIIDDINIDSFRSNELIYPLFSLDIGDQVTIGTYELVLENIEYGDKYTISFYKVKKQ